MRYPSAAARCLITGSLAVLRLLAPDHLAAQADGTPIRIQTALKPGTWITGAAIGITPDSIGIVPTASADTLRFARSELHTMEVSQGRKSNAGRGALIGGGVVGGLGLVLGVACAATTDESDWVGCGANEVVAITAVGALSGAALGALIGATSHRERWAPARLAPNVSVGGGGRVRVGLKVPF